MLDGVHGLRGYGSSMVMRRRSTIPRGRYADLARRLRAARDYYGLGSMEFAEAADVPFRSYSQWESGQFRPSIEGAIKLRERWALSLDFIFVGRLETLPVPLAQAVARHPMMRPGNGESVVIDMTDSKKPQ